LKAAAIANRLAHGLKLAVAADSCWNSLSAACHSPSLPGLTRQKTLALAIAFQAAPIDQGR
jgi:hypothetical protein